MFNLFSRFKKQPPPATNAQEEEWNSKEYNQALAAKLKPEAVKAIRDADMKSKRSYDEMDEDIGLMKDARACLNSAGK